MNITDAAYATVHDYPGGSVSLSPRLGICEEWIHIGWGGDGPSQLQRSAPWLLGVPGGGKQGVDRCGECESVPSELHRLDIAMPLSTRRVAG